MATGSSSIIFAFSITKVAILVKKSKVMEESVKDQFEAKAENSIIGHSA